MFELTQNDGFSVLKILIFSWLLVATTWFYARGMCFFDGTKEWIPTSCGLPKFIYHLFSMFNPWFLHGIPHCFSLKSYKPSDAAMTRPMESFRRFSCRSCGRCWTMCARRAPRRCAKFARPLAPATWSQWPRHRMPWMAWFRSQVVRFCWEFGWRYDGDGFFLEHSTLRSWGSCTLQGIDDEFKQVGFKNI